MRHHIIIASLAAAAIAGPALAAKAPPVELAKCNAPIGTVALVDGDTQGWAKFGLGSPRPLIAALARESGCFTIHNPASGTPANFLMNVIAGDKEEVDQGVEMGKGLAMQGLVSSGAAGGLLGGVPGGGRMLGMLGGLGGKKKTVAAGIRMISPMNGMTIVSGSGEVKSSSINFGNAGVPGAGWVQGAKDAGYDSKNGKMLTEAFIIAFNAVVAQRSAIASVVSAMPAPAQPGSR